MGWAVRLARHLEALHLHGVAHGNVSPACVMIENQSPLSRGLVADVRRTAEMIQYHSPERFRSGQLSPQDDAWGLAGTLFTMLTTARPFGELRPEIEARIYQGVPPLGAYGIADDQLYAIIAAALSPDPTRRTPNVMTFRLHLEHWANDPRVRELPPLEDEEGAEDDQAATAMVAMEAMVMEEPSTSRPGSLASLPDSQVFAPPSFQPSSNPQSGAGAPPPRPSRPQAPPPIAAGPLGEQDATVMRELPAHIIAMAARAASGSNPPPPDAAPPEPEDEPDFGQATKIAHGPDIQTLLAQQQQQQQQQPPPQPAQPPRPPPPAAGAPPTPRGVPRAFKQTQLGVQAPAGVPPAPPMAPPRAGFAAPAAPAPDQDDVRTRMHDVGEYPFPAGGGPSPAPPVVAAPDDDDDGGRTVMRESPALSPEMFQQPSPQAQWKPAPPPVQARAFGVGHTDRPPAQAAPLPNPPAPDAGGGVSALIQETLQNMGPANAGPPPGFPPPGAQSGFEPTGGLPPTPGPFQPTSGPFQPVGFPPPGPGPDPIPGGFDLHAGIGPAPGPMGGQMLDAPSMDAPPPGMELAPGGYPAAPPPPVKAKGGSKAGLIIVCLLVLVLAAALTFLALKFRTQLGFPPPTAPTAPAETPPAEPAP